MKVYVSKNKEGNSIYQVGAQLASMIPDICSQELAKTPKDLVGEDWVIVLDTTTLSSLLPSQRFAGFQNIALLFGNNFEEYPKHQLAPVVISAADNKLKLIIVHSRHTLDLWSRFVKGYFSASVATKVLGITKLCLWGVGSEFKFNTKLRNPSKWIVPFNRICHGQKNLRLHHKLTEQLKDRYVDVESLFLVNKDMVSEDLSVYTAYNVVYQQDRAFYLDMTKDVGAFLCVSNYESFGIYYLEMMSAGVVGVFLDKPWITKLLPKYPLIVSSGELLPAMIEVYKDLPKWQKMLEEYVSTYFPIFKFSRVEKDLREILQPLL